MDWMVVQCRFSRRLSRNRNLSLHSMQAEQAMVQQGIVQMQRDLAKFHKPPRQIRNHDAKLVR
jgi:hypothetical protein